MALDTKVNFNPAAIILIILGIIAVAFPLASTMTVGFLTALVFILIAVSLFLSGSQSFKFNKAVSILSIILAILSLIAGLNMLVNPMSMSGFAGFLTYFAGFILIINGISLIFVGLNYKQFILVGVLNLIFGIIYLYLAIYVANPVFYGVLIGIWLIIAGILNLFTLDYADYQNV